MRLKPPQPILCFCLLVQITVAHPKNDYLKNSQRTNPKKYHPTTSTQRSLVMDPIKLRHSSSKFPRFDQLKTRIDGLDSSKNNKGRYSDSTSRYFSDSKWRGSDSVPRLRHHGWSNRGRSTTSTTTTTTTTLSPDEDLFHNYGELDDEQMEDDYQDNIFDTLPDDDDDEYSLQAEEPSSTERPSTTPEPRTYSSLTDYKWKQLGTMERVQQARNNYMQRKDSTLKKSPEEKQISAVVEHYIRVKNSGQCKRPIPKVIPVHVEHPNLSVTYIPHCTILHRCAEDTGCCKYDATCQYKERVEVSLDFYVKYIGADEMKPEKLTFYNHTECECREKSEESPKVTSSTTERLKRLVDTSETTNVKSSSEIINKLGVATQNNAPESLLKKCKCPKEFIPIIKYGTKCYCDCNNNNEDCLRMKKGKEYNSLTDRLCIQKRECGTVSCEYGPYNKVKGRCPRYDEA